MHLGKTLSVSEQKVARGSAHGLRVKASCAVMLGHGISQGTVVPLANHQSQLLRAQESVLRTLSMTLRAPAPLCRSAGRGTTFIVGELISYAVDFSGDPGSCLAGSAPAARCGQRAQKRTHTRRSKPHRGRDFILLFNPPILLLHLSEQSNIRGVQSQSELTKRTERARWPG